MAMHPGPRSFGGVNWIGLRTLSEREVRRFLKVAAQTVIGPVVTTLLFLVVFSVALGRRAAPADGIAYLEFLAPGLIMMTMAQNAFANTSSSLLIAKVQGTIGDLLMAPLSAGELVCGFALGGVTRGLLVGIVVGLATWPFVRFGFTHPGYLMFHALAASLLLALLGILAGLWSQKMDQLAAVTNFVIAPLTFLSGTFYSIGDLPSAFRAVAYLDPFFYMVDGFRYGIAGHADGPLAIGLMVMIVANIALAGASRHLIMIGWQLKP
ncbi:MAG: ABC transporter permease [Proteobacteria bacterium]|nr:ABC transporter permease [Pseudomonadota bacterium]MBI3498582.1 ABC transporter permease [Pseudomonadota bacterium]